MQYYETDVYQKYTSVGFICFYLNPIPFFRLWRNIRNIVPFQSCVVVNLYQYPTITASLLG